jgi:hypothetical protein
MHTTLALLEERDLKPGQNGTNKDEVKLAKKAWGNADSKNICRASVGYVVPLPGKCIYGPRVAVRKVMVHRSPMNKHVL